MNRTFLIVITLILCFNGCTKLKRESRFYPNFGMETKRNTGQTVFMKLNVRTRPDTSNFKIDEMETLTYEGILGQSLVLDYEYYKWYCCWLFFRLPHRIEKHQYYFDIRNYKNDDTLRCRDFTLRISDLNNKFLSYKILDGGEFYKEPESSLKIDTSKFYIDSTEIDDFGEKNFNIKRKKI